MSIESMTLFGNRIGECRYRGNVSNPFVTFYSRRGVQDSFSIREEHMFRHILLLGGSGYGKTNVINQVMAVVTNRQGTSEGKKDVSIVFDTKGDFERHPGFCKPGDIVIGNSTEYLNRSPAWNVFDEIMIDGEEDQKAVINAKEIAAVLFTGRGSDSQPFFCNAARDIFSAAMIHFIRSAKRAPGKWRQWLNNADLIRFLRANDATVLRSIFNNYSDLQGVNTYFGDGSSDQSLGVFAELQSMLNDCFIGVFARKPDALHPSFSARSAVRAKQGRKVFIEYDLSQGETLTPIYRLLVDLSLKEALGRNNEENDNTFVFLDELKLLPLVSHLEDALNFGRGKRVSIIAGLQSVNQLYAIYGRERGEAILGGFGTLIAMRCIDPESRRYISERLGRNVVGYRYSSRSQHPVDREREGFTAEDWDQLDLQTGEAFVSIPSQSEPFRFEFMRDPAT